MRKKHIASEEMEKALDSAEFMRQELIAAARESTMTEGIILFDLIEESVKMIQKIENLIAAHNEDLKSSTDESQSVYRSNPDGNINAGLMAGSTRIESILNPGILN